LSVRPTPSPCKTTLVKKPQEMQAGRNEIKRPSKNKCLLNKWKTKTANRMEWRSVVGAIKAGTRLQLQCDEDDDDYDDDDDDDDILY